MHYAARSPEENKLVGEMYTPGHTDLGSITLLFRQPVCGLQILNSEGQWKWVVSSKPGIPFQCRNASMLFNQHYQCGPRMISVATQLLQSTI